LIRLLGDFAFGFVGGVFDFSLEALDETFQECRRVNWFFAGLELVGESDVAGEVGEHNAPGEGIFPGAGAEANMLALLGHPDAQDFKGGFVASGGGWDLEVLVGWHDADLPVLAALGPDNL